MKFISVRVFVVVVFVGALFTGCKRAPVQPVKIDPGAAAGKADLFLTAIETFRYPENPRDSDDWTRYRDALQHLAAHFTKEAVIGRNRLTLEERAFLENEIKLSPEELTEVESSLFRTADAHFLDECFLLHDVAHSVLDVAGARPMEQARLHFGWVMRNVMLHEQGDSCTPPAFALRRGHGSALERAMVFLALLRQIQIEGCLIVVPDTNPLVFLVGVHDAKTSSLRLFDTRLGLPLASKDGKGVATLKDAFDDPSLLKASMIAPEQAKKLEAWLVCPFYALAPRMLELETQLNLHDTIALSLNPVALKKEIAKSAPIPVKAWGANLEITNSSDSVRPTITPTRWLRAFLPKQEGGADESSPSRVTWYAQAIMPMQSVMARYADVNLTQELLPNHAYLMLQHISRDLLKKYSVHTRELYLRGKYDPMILRQERLQAFTKDDALSGLGGNPKFHNECLDWIKKLKEANAELPDDPKLSGKAALALQAKWFQDEFIGWLITVDKEKRVLERGDKNQPEDAKTMLAKILALGMRGYFELELARSQASTNHEKADHAAAALRSHAKPSQSAVKRARDAWEIAKSSWSNFYIDRISLAQTIGQQRLLFRALAPRNEGQRIDRDVSLAEDLHLTVRKYFHAKLRLAECLEALDEKKTARSYLEDVKKEIETLEKKGLLAEVIKDVRTEIPNSSPYSPLFQQRLDLLARDWSADGNYFWLKKQIDERVAHLTKKPQMNTDSYR